MSSSLLVFDDRQGHTSRFADLLSACRRCDDSLHPLDTGVLAHSFFMQLICTGSMLARNDDQIVAFRDVVVD